MIRIIAIGLAVVIPLSIVFAEIGLLANLGVPSGTIANFLYGILGEIQLPNT